MRIRTPSRLPLFALSLMGAACGALEQMHETVKTVAGTTDADFRRVDNQTLDAACKERSEAFRVVVADPVLIRGRRDGGGYSHGRDLVESGFAKAGFVPVAGTAEQRALLRTREPAGELQDRVEFRPEDQAALRGCDYLVYPTIDLEPPAKTNGSSWHAHVSLRVFWIRTGEVVLRGKLHARGGTDENVASRAAEVLAAKLTTLGLWGAKKG